MVRTAEGSDLGWLYGSECLRLAESAVASKERFNLQVRQVMGSKTRGKYVGYRLDRLDPKQGSFPENLALIRRALLTF